jgi:hypothetical protein
MASTTTTTPTNGYTPAERTVLATLISRLGEEAGNAKFLEMKALKEAEVAKAKADKEKKEADKKAKQAKPALTDEQLLALLTKEGLKLNGLGRYKEGVKKRTPDAKKFAPKWADYGKEVAGAILAHPIGGERDPCWLTLFTVKGIKGEDEADEEHTVWKATLYGYSYRISESPVWHFKEGVAKDFDDIVAVGAHSKTAYNAWLKTVPEASLPRWTKGKKKGELYYPEQKGEVRAHGSADIIQKAVYSLPIADPKKDFTLTHFNAGTSLAEALGKDAKKFYAEQAEAESLASAGAGDAEPEAEAKDEESEAETFWIDDAVPAPAPAPAPVPVPAPAPAPKKAGVRKAKA